LARNRFVRIALFPVLAPIFLFGWLLFYFGEQTPAVKKSSRQVAKAAQDDVVKIGVLGEVTDEIELLKKSHEKGSSD